MKGLRVAIVLALALMALAGPAWAGVVEDAEESLQAVPSDNPARRPLQGGADSFASGDGDTLRQPMRDGSSATSGNSATGSRRGVGSANGSAGLSDPALPNAEETPVLNEAAVRRAEQERADNLMSLGGLLLLLALVVVAGLYSRRARPDD